MCLGDTARFVCAATSDGVASMFYLVNSMSITNVANQGIAVSATMSIANILFVNLTVRGSVENNNSLITCKVILPGISLLESSAYLSIQGTCTCN